MCHVVQRTGFSPRPPTERAIRICWAWPSHGWPGGATRDLETTLVDRLQAFLLELGYGFAIVGRQYQFAVDGDDS